MNLLTNAIKYAYNNTPLKLAINSNNGEASFAFTNKSPYISEEKQKSLAKTEFGPKTGKRENSLFQFFV